MMFLEADLAIYKRLVGYPLDSKGRPALDATGVPINRERIGPPDLNPVEKLYDPVSKTFTPLLPVLPSYGVRIPLLVPPFKADRGLTSRDPDALRAFAAGFDPVGMKQVPVFDQNITGRKYDDVWPCVTFRLSSVEAEPKTFIYHDPFVTPNSQGAPGITASPAVNITSTTLGGSVIQSGYAQSLVRPEPESWNMLYTITAQAKTQMEMELVANQIMYLFPMKGSINLTFQSGEVHCHDMLLLRTATLDPEGDDDPMSRGQQEQREFKRAFIYQVEGYFDNTTNQFGVQDVRVQQVITQRLFEIDNLMNGAVWLPPTDLNQLELAPISPQSFP